MNSDWLVVFFTLSSITLNISCALLLKFILSSIEVDIGSNYRNNLSGNIQCCKRFLYLYLGNYHLSHFAVWFLLFKIQIVCVYVFDEGNESNIPYSISHFPVCFSCIYCIIYQKIYTHKIRLSIWHLLNANRFQKNKIKHLYTYHNINYN
jgi:hypothetical protein